MRPTNSMKKLGPKLEKNAKSQSSLCAKRELRASSSASLQKTLTPSSTPTLKRVSTLPRKPTLQNHCGFWKNCQACQLHETRHKTALFRGDCPCDVLIVGNAPNEAENIQGSPLIGEDGRVLDELVNLCLKQQCRASTVEEDFGSEFDIAYDCTLPTSAGVDKVIGGSGSAIADYVVDVHLDYPSLAVGYTNINACAPWQIKNNVRSGMRPLTKVEALACRPRLLDIIKLCQPRAIITLGKEATRFLPKPKEGLPSTVQFVEEVIHPFALGRLERDDPIRYQECRNRSILTLVRAKRRLWGLEE